MLDSNLHYILPIRSKKATKSYLRNNHKIKMKTKNRRIRVYLHSKTLHFMVCSSGMWSASSYVGSSTAKASKYLQFYSGFLSMREICLLFCWHFSRSDWTKTLHIRKIKPSSSFRWAFIIIPLKQSYTCLLKENRLLSARLHWIIRVECL